MEFQDLNNINTVSEKHIEIKGIHNRYQIKKVNREIKPIFRKKVEHWKPQFFSLQEQLDILLNYEQEDKLVSPLYSLITSEIRNKINGYKQQDILKKIYNLDTFITHKDVIDMIQQKQLVCYYCLNSCLILYEKVREKNQWTLDRIDNSQGHNKTNVVLACLECNLKRKNKNNEAFVFTKQLKINKID